MKNGNQGVTYGEVRCTVHLNASGWDDMLKPLRAIDDSDSTAQLFTKTINTLVELESRLENLGISSADEIDEFVMQSVLSNIEKKELQLSITLAGNTKGDK